MQLGGYEPEKLGLATELCDRYGQGYGEINLNCGCPSQRVSQRSFGAKLMLEPDLVREIVAAMGRRTSKPITVKCRIGADNRDSYEELQEFIMAAHSGGVNKFIIHSRKCILKGLTTKQNREIPPLKYEVVHRLCRDFPELTFVLNGGITTFAQAQTHLDPSGYHHAYSVDGIDGTEGNRMVEVLPPVHGCMIGRQAWSHP
jgi:tRNA-dihydrouridine synthase A